MGTYQIRKLRPWVQGDQTCLSPPYLVLLPVVESGWKLSVQLKMVILGFPIFEIIIIFFSSRPMSYGHTLGRLHFCNVRLESISQAMTKASDWWLSSSDQKVTRKFSFGDIIHLFSSSSSVRLTATVRYPYQKDDSTPTVWPFYYMPYKRAERASTASLFSL